MSGIDRVERAHAGRIATNADEMHREGTSRNDLRILAAAPAYGQRQNAGTAPSSDRRGDVRGECKLTETRRHRHEATLPPIAFMAQRPRSPSSAHRRAHLHVVVGRVMRYGKWIQPLSGSGAFQITIVPLAGRNVDLSAWCGPRTAGSDRRARHVEWTRRVASDE